MLSISLATIAVALVFVVLGTYYGLHAYERSREIANSNPFNTNTTLPLKTESGATYFDLPNALPHWTAKVSVICTVINSSLVQNSPAYVNVTLVIDSLTLNVHIIGAGIDVEPINAIEVRPYHFGNNIFYETDNPPRFSSISCYWRTSDTFHQTYSGSDWVLFQDAGQIDLRIKLTMLPT